MGGLDVSQSELRKIEDDFPVDGPCRARCAALVERACSSPDAALLPRALMSPFDDLGPTAI